MFESGTELLLDALPSVWDGSCEQALVPQVDGDATKAAKVRGEEGIRPEEEEAPRRRPSHSSAGPAPTPKPTPMCTYPVTMLHTL